MGIDEVPKFGITGQLFVFGSGQLGPEGEILQRVFVKNPVDDQAGVFLLKIDAVVTGAVAVEGPIRTFYDAETVGMTGEKIGGEDIKFAQHLDLQGGGKLADLRRASGGEDDLESRHAWKLKFKFKSK